jgi:hypothetical protein
MSKQKKQWPPAELIIDGYTFEFIRTQGNRYHYFSNRKGRDELLSKKEVEQILNKPSF